MFGNATAPAVGAIDAQTAKARCGQNEPRPTLGEAVELRGEVLLKGFHPDREDRILGVNDEHGPARPELGNGTFDLGMVEIGQQTHNPASTIHQKPHTDLAGGQSKPEGLRTRRQVDHFPTVWPDCGNDT